MRLAEWLMTFLAVGFIFYILTFGAILFRAEAECYRYGYVDAHVPFTLTAYCSREENEYEIIKPLSEIYEEQAVE
jgi:hypothetical protein